MNRNNLWKKAMIFTIIMLFIGASIIPSISGNIEKVNGAEDTDYIESLSSNSDILFSDNFDDNSKNYDKWTEVTNDGTWDETGGKTVFTLHEHKPTYTITVKSIDIEADIEEGPVEISCDMITYLEHYGGHVGQLAFIVKSQENSIDVRYYRNANDLKVSDNKGTYVTLFNREETSTPWDITITIEENQYKVEVFGSSTGWISQSILSDCASFNVSMYMEINGDYEDYWWKAGFDNVIVTGEICNGNIPPVAKFLYSPDRPDTDDTVVFTDMSTDEDGTIDRWWWEFGNEDDTSSVQNPEFQFTAPGDYQVALTVFDNDGAEHTCLDTITVSKPTDHRPNIADKPEGETKPKINEQYTYKFRATDPDDNELLYVIDWDGDGNADERTSLPCPSGQIKEVSHTWRESGTCEVKVIAEEKPEDGGRQSSEWSEPLKVVPKKKGKSHVNDIDMMIINKHPFNRLSIVNYIEKIFIDGFPNVFFILEQFWDLPRSWEINV